jgi:NADPH:quinone reductase-like Zn-dependent oxidoreductase
VFADLTGSGADIVHLDDATAAEDVRKTIGDARVALAVDSVGGDAPARLLDLLSDGGSLVTYASATGQPMSVNALTLIGKRVTVRGFFAGQFDYATKVLPVIREAAPWSPAERCSSRLPPCSTSTTSTRPLNSSGAAGRSCSPWAGPDPARL